MGPCGEGVLVHKAAGDPAQAFADFAPWPLHGAQFSELSTHFQGQGGSVEL
jgi:hypothetical protein